MSTKLLHRRRRGRHNLHLGEHRGVCVPGEVKKWPQSRAELQPLGVAAQERVQASPRPRDEGTPLQACQPSQAAWGGVGKGQARDLLGSPTGQTCHFYARRCPKEQSEGALLPSSPRTRTAGSSPSSTCPRKGPSPGQQMHNLLAQLPLRS